MSFHLGKPILVMLAIAAVSGAFISIRRDRPPRDLVIWLFADMHGKTYEPLLDEFEKQTGKRVEIQVMTTRAENVRLESMFMTGQSSPDVLPDLVEIEISHIGKFFRPPLDEIGLLPLNDFLKRSGWDRRIVATRLATWSKDGVVFGIPHDVHPCSLTYRKDLWDEAGIDLERVKTWPEFHEQALKFEKCSRGRGFLTRHAIELPRGAADYLIVMLLQRGVNVIDQDQRVRINDPVVAQTMAFYAQLVGGDRAVAAEAMGTAGNSGIWANDAAAGNICSFITPDWRIFNFRRFAPSLAGKLRTMPLPVFDPGDAPTATWGGTMMGITRNSRNPEEAWNLIERLYLSQAGLEARLKYTDIIPPVIEQWNDPAFHREDPFFGGQKIQELFVDLAGKLRPRFVTAVTGVAQASLSVALNRAVTYVNRNGPAGLEAACQKWLDEAAVDLKRRIEHDLFDDAPANSARDQSPLPPGEAG